MVNDLYTPPYIAFCLYRYAICLCLYDPSQLVQLFASTKPRVDHALCSPSLVTGSFGLRMSFRHLKLSVQASFELLGSGTQRMCWLPCFVRSARSLGEHEGLTIETKGFSCVLEKVVIC